ncbi:MAG: hypothetical protein ACI9MF_002449 [Gammaproteobacteria bacterium]|jgi:hypothetical protein
MIAKKRDAQSDVIQALEAQAESTRDLLKRGACISAALRLRTDSPTKRAAQHIDLYFAQREDWAVIHDLRMRVGSHAIQINHVLIHNSLQIYCLDSRYMNCQIELTGNGQYKVLNAVKTQSIASPLVKMSKDVRLLKSCLESAGWAPKRFGIKLNTDVRGGVLVGAKTVKKNERFRFSNVGIYPGETLFTGICERDRYRSSFLRGRLSSDALAELAALLVRQHMPIFPPHLLGDPTSTPLDLSADAC